MYDVVIGTTVKIQEAFGTPAAVGYAVCTCALLLCSLWILSFPPRVLYARWRAQKAKA